MNTNAIDMESKLEPISAPISTIRGRLMEIQQGNEACTALVRTNNRNLNVTIPNALLDSGMPSVHSVVELDVLTVSSEAPVAERLEILHAAEDLPMPFDQISHSNLDLRHIYLRSEKMLATAHFRHFINKYAREYLDEHDCINVQTPILTEASCVCSGDVFTFPYYGKKIASLIQSPWMYADVMTSGFDRVYTLNPSFRREKEASSTHLVEIWQMQVDIAWASNSDIMEMEEGLLQHIASSLKTWHQDLYDLAGLSSSHLDAILKPFHSVTYRETIDIIKGQGIAIEYGEDYSAEQQDVLAAQFDRPFFITDFPQKLKNFWFPVYEDRPDLTPSNDLFAHTGHGELIGGGERVSDTEQLRKNLKLFFHDEDEFDWFVDTRKYGCIPHAGFSTGFDRLVAFMMGVEDITQASIFPRIPHGPIKP